MTDEERQRQMDFIVNTLAQVSVRLDGIAMKVDSLTDTQSKTEQERRADEIRIGRLEESYVTLIRIEERFAERLDNNQMRVEGVEIAQSMTEQERRADEIRIARLEEAYATMTLLVERSYERLDNHETRIEGVEQAIVILTRLVEKYDAKR